ncbi:hypothetical protein Droror1_Dr00009968 [Drosera rotundifolia]
MKSKQTESRNQSSYFYARNQNPRQEQPRSQRSLVFSSFPTDPVMVFSKPGQILSHKKGHMPEELIVEILLRLMILAGLRFTPYDEVRRRSKPIRDVSLRPQI